MKTNELNNGVQNTIEGMDVKMVNVNLGNVVKGLGMDAEVVKGLVIELGLTIVGKKIMNVESTAAVVEAVKELIAQNEVAVSNTNNDKKEGIEMTKELMKRLRATKYKVYRSAFMNIDELNEYNESVKIMKENDDIAERLNKMVDKRDLLLKIMAQLEEGKFTFKMYNAFKNNKNFLTEAEYNTADLALTTALGKSAMKNYKNILAVKRWTKDIPVVLLRRVISFGSNIFSAEVAPQMESSLIRACKIEEKIVADSKMTLEGRTTDELLLFSFDKDSLQFNSNNEKDNIAKKDDLIGVFQMIAGNAMHTKAFIVERVSGMVDFYTNRDNIKLNKGEVIKQYEFLGITPSGLRSGTMTLAITKEIHVDSFGIETEINRDRRIEMLDKASDNAFTMNFIDGYNEDGTAIFKGCDSLLDAFKEMSRMMLCATSSKVLGTVSSYVVLNNIAQNAGHNEDKDKYTEPCFAGEEGFVDCSDTTDGLGLIAAEFGLERLHAFDIPCSVKDLLGMTFQSRGGGLKIASMLRSKAAMKLEAKAALLRGAKILKAIHNGVELNVEELLKDEALLNEFLDNLQGLFDKNGMKLIEHDNNIEIVVLKKAYSSDSRLSDVLNIIMMITDEGAATALLSKKVKESILDKIRDLGIEMDYDHETEEISNVRYNFAKLKGLNNDSQIANWIFKSFPEEMIAVAPGVHKTNLNSLLKGVANLVNILNVDVDCEYTVVQSDAAVRFGVRILHEDEIYCPSLTEAKKISGVRHPVSNLFAVSTFKSVTLNVIAERISKLHVSTEIKNMLFEFYKGVDGYAIIPASHYYMEKHDGMDFDIDAMQFFKDKEVIAILEKVKDIGTIIDRKLDEAMGCSIDFSADDRAMMAHTKDLNDKNFKPIGYGLESLDAATPIKQLPGMAKIKTMTVAEETNTHYKKNADGKYPLDFSSVAMMVLDYFLNPIDSVGIMASDFYNNAKILMALRSTNDDITNEMKSFIVHGMKQIFSCEGTKKYVSPIRRDKNGKALDFTGRVKITLSKDICHRVIKAFVASAGTYADCVQFLTDACICSRYPAETSIDSAKKMYKVINMFAMSSCIKAMGCKNAVAFVNYDPFKKDEDGNLIEEVESTEAFNNIINIFNLGRSKEESKYTLNNYFGLKLIKENKKCIGWDSADKAQWALTTKSKVAGIKDPTYILKERLMNFANSAVIYAAKELEAYVKSPAAADIRNDFKKSYTQDKYFRVEKVISNIVGTYITLTESIKISSEDEIDDVTSKKYLASYALQACRNTANLAFKTAKNPLTDEQIGAGVFYYMITSFEQDTTKCSTVHSEIFTIFQNEILAFLKSKDMEVLAGEKIEYAVNPDTNRQVKIADLVGLSCSAYKGHGSVELLDDDASCLITLENKKATFENGTIECINGKYAVIVERKTLEENVQSGFYFGAKMEEGIFQAAKLLMNDAHKTCCHPVDLEMTLGQINPNAMLAEKNFDEILFKVERKQDDNGRWYKANLIVGVKDDQDFVIAELYINTVVANQLNGTSLSLNNLRLFMTEDSCCVNIVDNDLIAEVDQATTSGIDSNADLFGSMDNFNEKVDLYSDVSMPVEGLEYSNESHIAEAASDFHDSDIAPVDLYADLY